MNRIRKNDTVAVLTGKDKDKTGQVIEIFSDKGKVKVKGIALATKHAKARKQGETGGIKKIEACIDISNVMPVCSACHKPTRVGFVQSEDNKKMRMCRRCEKSF